MEPATDIGSARTSLGAFLELIQTLIFSHPSVEGAISGLIISCGSSAEDIKLDKSL